MLAAKFRVLRYYYTGLVCDVIDRGLLASTLPASTEVLESMAEKGWLVPLPATSRMSPRPWVVTDAGKEEIDRRVTRRVEGKRG
jgi:hypothetical protein